MERMWQQSRYGNWYVTFIKYDVTKPYVNILGGTTLVNQLSVCLTFLQIHLIYL